MTTMLSFGRSERPAESATQGSARRRTDLRTDKPRTFRRRAMSVLLAGALSLGSVLIPATQGAAAADTTTGLKLWYKFDAGTGTVVADASGNNNNGTLVNGPTWISGGGINLDGSNDHVKLPDNILSTFPAITVTMDVWVDAPAIGNSNYFLFNLGNAATWPNGNGYLYATDQGSNLRGGIALTGGEGAQVGGGEKVVRRAPVSALPRGTWKSVAYTINGNVGTLFEEGVQVGQATNTGTALPSALGGGTTTANYIGRSAYGGDLYLRGKVRDFRLYNRALPASDISELVAANAAAAAAADTAAVAGDKTALTLGDTSAVIDNLTLPASGTNGSAVTWSSSNPNFVTNSGLVERPALGDPNASVTLTATIKRGAATDTKTFTVTVLAATSAVPPADQLTDGLKYWFKLNETSGTVAVNSAPGATANGSYVGSPTFVDGGVKLDGVDDYVALPNNVMTGMSTITVSGDVWIDADQTSTYFLYNLGGTASTAANTGTGQFFQTGNAYRGAISTTNYSAERGVTKNPAGNLARGTWKHVSYSINGNVHKLYEDGVQVGNATVASTPLPSAIGGGVTTNNAIGKSAYANDKLLKGQAKDFRVYNRALSSAEIASLALPLVDADVTAGQAALTLGDTSGVTKNLTLPTAGPNGTTVTWATADVGVITNTGVITRNAVGQPDGTTTLTATLKKGKVTATKSFTIVVRSEFTDAQSAEAAAGELSVVNINDVRGNLDLPTTGTYGTTVSWTSATPATISNTGEVTRPAYGKGTKLVQLTATVAKNGQTFQRVFTATVRPLPKAMPKTDYLFTYFTGEGTANGEQLYRALSVGGSAITYAEMDGGSPFLTSKFGDKGVRDPFIIRSPEGDKFYMIATDLKINGNGNWDASQRTGSKYIEVWESTDLVNWSEQRHVKVSPDTAGNTWAPEAYYDDEIGAYVVFWASKLYAETDPNHTGNTYNRMMYTTTRDFVTFTPAQVWVDPGYSVIDSTVIKEGQYYYRFTKDERNNTSTTPCSKFITAEKSTELRDTSYDFIADCIGKTTPTNPGVSQGEGPSVFKSNTEEKWYLFIDEFGGRGYVPFETTNLDSGVWTLSTGYNLPASPRHGTPIGITAAEFNHLKNGTAPTPDPLTATLVVNPAAATGDNGWYTAPVTVDVNPATGSEAPVTTQVDTDGLGYVANTAPVAITADGTYPVKGRALQGAVISEDATATVKIDGTKPATTSAVADYTVTLTATDATSGVAVTKYKIDTGAWNDYTVPFVVAGAGAHQVQFASTDQAGNVETTKTITVQGPQIADTTAPVLTVTVAPATANGANGWYTSAVTLTATATDPVVVDEVSSGVATIEYKIGAGSWAAYTGAITAPAGTTDYAFRARDIAGNNSTETTRTIKFDAVKPTTGATKTGSTTATVTVTATDATSGIDTVEYRIGTGAWTAYTAPVEVAAGTTDKTVEYRATDKAGNIADVKQLTVAGIADPSLLLWYKFDETNGATVATDSSGYGRNGSFVRTSAFETGKNGGAFTLTGGGSTSATATYATIPNSVLQGLNDVSVSTWVKWDSTTTNNQFLYALGADTNKYLFTTPRYSSTGNPVRTGITVGSYQNEKSVAGTAPLPGGVWKHLVTTLNTTTQTLTLYVDGQQVGTVTGVTIKASDLYDSTKTVAGYVGKSFYNDPYFDGAVDDFKIYNRALTAAEVAADSGNTTGILGVTLDSLKVPALIDAAAGTVLLPVKPDTNLAAIAPTFTLATGATISPNNGVAQNFTNPVTYTVTGAGGSGTKTWTVTARKMNSPIIPGKYADPNVVVFGNKFYIYPTTDGFDGWSGTQFKVFSSTDLVNWTDHGVILDLGPDVAWADARAWAPTAIEKNGKYYFYFSADQNIGVAVANSPIGPFTEPLGVPLVNKATYGNAQQIDPAVFTDTDGQSYLFWGNGTARYVPLNADMISYDQAQVKTITGLTNFREGLFINKRANTYYLSWSIDDTGSENYSVGYATGPSVAGPWTNQGVILSKDLSLGIKGPGHHSIVQVPGTDDWYIVYHRFAMPNGNGFNRETTIDKLEFNADGTIKKVIPTLESISPVSIPGPVDTTAPVTTGTVSAANPAIVTLAATDNTGGSGVSKIEYRIAPSTTWVAYTTPVSVPKTSAAQTVEFRATDVAGNVEATKSVIVPAVVPPADTNAPVTTGTVSAANPAIVTLTATDNTGGSGVSKIEYRIAPSTTWIAYTTPVSVPKTSAVQTVEFRATDVAGNVEATKSVTVPVAPDTTAPVSTGTVSAADPAVVTLTATDNAGGSGVSKVEYRLVPSTTWVTYTAPVSVPKTASIQSVEFRATDSAGNVEATKSVQVPAVVPPADTTAPVAVLTIAPVAPVSGWHTSEVLVSVSATDNKDAAPVRQINLGSGWVGYAAPVTLSADGTVTVQARASDVAGNVSEVKTVTVKIDTVAPVSSATVDEVARKVSIVGADATSGLDRIEYKIDSGDWATYTGAVTVPGGGAATVFYRAIDKAGLVQNTQQATVPAAGVVLKDSATVGAAAASWTYGAAASVSVRVSGIGGTPTGDVEVRNGDVVVGTGVLAAGKVTISLGSSLPAGSHSLTVVYAGDAEFAGSTDTIDVTIAKADSAVAAKLAAATVRYGNNAVVTVKVTAPGGTPDGAVTVKSGTAVLGSGMLVDGKVTFTIRNSISVKVHELVVSYAGNGNLAPSTTTVPLTVLKAKSTVKAVAPPTTMGKNSAKVVRLQVTTVPTVSVIGTATVNFTLNGVVKASTTAQIRAGAGAFTWPAMKVPGVYRAKIAFNPTSTVEGSTTEFIVTVK